MRNTRNTLTRSLLRSAALVLVAAGSAALVADEGAKYGDQLSEADPQQKQQPNTQAKPQQRTQQQRTQTQAQVRQRAQPKPTSTFGGYLSGVLPIGNLGNSVGIGIGVGGFWEMPLSGLSPKLTGAASVQYIMYSKKTWGIVESSSSQIGASYDMHYYFDKVYSGFYGLAGLGFHNCSMKVESSLSSPWLEEVYKSSSSSSSVKFGLEAGAGYCFTKNLGAEAKFFIGSDSWQYLQASLKFRF